MYLNTPCFPWRGSFRASRFVARTLLLLAALSASLVYSDVRAADAGVITGNVSNAQTGNHLEGVRIEIPALKQSTLTDNTGRYVISNVPAGRHEIVATYIGLDPVRAEVSVSNGQRAVRDFDLTSRIYQLDAFKVTGEREGNAAMITEKKNADNVKDVIAMDSFGYLPNMSAGEVVMRLPGVAGSPTDEGLAYRFNMRGMDPSLNNVTVDGGSLTTLGTNRSFELQSITGAMFEALELIKGHTPDKGADSLGGTINFKTRSTFSMKEKRRTTYNVSTRWAPPFLEQTPLRSQHRAHPILNVTHQEVFDVFGGERNLGMSLNLFYSENTVGGWETVLDHTNILNGPAPVFSYQTWDNTNNRKQMSVNFKADYRWSPTTKFSLAVTENDNFERHRRRVRVSAVTGGNTTAPGTSGVVPGQFTDTVTVVRPFVSGTSSNAANIDVQMDGPLNYYVRMGRVDFSGEHNYPNWLIEYTAGVAQTHLNNGQGRGGQLNMRLFNPATQTPGNQVVFGGAGWIVDQTQDAIHPRFIQNGGVDFTNPNNYLPRLNDGLSQQRNESDQLLKQFRYDMRYRAPFATPMFLKTGLHWRALDMELWGKDRHRWNYVGTVRYDPNLRVPHDPNYVSYDMIQTGRMIPFWQSHMVTNDGRPADPSLWEEDLYFHEQNKFTQTRGMAEEVGAVYLMGQGRLGRDGWRGRTGYLAGVRLEQVETASWGWTRSRRLSTTAERRADPVGTAQRDYADSRRDLHGKYTQRFPSVHVNHDITKDLKARLSWSTSYGRPALSNLLPNESINETNQWLTVNNPALRPQVASNWDATLEYYFEPVGSLTIGWFHKDIEDFIINNQEVRVISGGLDNGYEGEYEGFTERTSLNAGTMVAQGWEFAYQQQFTFLPGLLKGLAASFNYTWINTHGMRDGNTYLTRREVAGFIPHAANASLTWRHRKFNARVLYNFTGEYITSYNANNPALRQYRFSMKTVNVGVGYSYRPWLNFTVDAANILNEPQEWYVGYKNRLRRHIENFVTVTLGVNGRF
ncbi:MAG: TonB-dependent receptor [Opitutaceae bacterium]|nr:TonB-dependent receptor [Opitutaceae bacterium]